MILKNRSVFVIFLFSSWLLRPVHRDVRADLGYWVYQVTEEANEYEISRTPIPDGTTETVVVISKFPTFSLVSIMPPEEIAAAETFMSQTAFYANQPGVFFHDYFDPDTFCGRADEDQFRLFVNEDWFNHERVSGGFVGPTQNFRNLTRADADVRCIRGNDQLYHL